VALRALSVPGGCQFPAEWHGKWFESGVGDVIVTSRNISRKGFCLENDDDFYLLENQYAGKTGTDSIRRLGRPFLNSFDAMRHQRKL